MTTRAAPYELLHELGRGGVGIVHLARAPDGRLVVVKRLRPELARNVDVRRHFLEEARVASRIKHPNVVAVLSTGFEDGGAPWIEMEWAPGVSLQALADSAPLPWDLYVSLLLEVLAGLHAAHTMTSDDGERLDLVHRDVSPHNVLVTFEGHAKILDFGIAKVRDSSLETSTGVVKGKVSYLAPEQAARAPLDARTDVFAVGVMMWQQLAGRRLWEGRTEVEIFHRLTEGPIPALTDVASSVPDALARVVDRALARDPAGRFESAGALQHALLEASPPRTNATAAVAAHLAGAFAGDIASLAQYSARAPRSLRAEASTTRNTTTTTLPSPTHDDAPTRWRDRKILFVAAGVVATLAIAIAAFRAPLSSRAEPHPAPPAPSVCTTDEACGAGAHCGEDGACVDLRHEGCTAILPDAPTGSHPLYVGALFPLSGPDADAYGRSNARAAELAVREMNRLAGGVPAGAVRRPLGLLSCDDAVDARARGEFLASRVPAVIGFRSSDEALTLARDVFFPRGVLAISALNTSPLLSQLPAGDPRLFYRTTASATGFAESMAQAVVAMVAPEVRRRRRLPAGARIRVVAARVGNATGIAYAEKLLRALAASPDIDASELALGDPTAPGNSTVPAAIDALVATPPDVVVALSDGLFAALVDPVERRLRGGESVRPIYVGATPWEDASFRAFVAERPERRRRFFAVSWPTSGRPLVGFVERYKESFDDAITPATASPAPYDSVYLLGYAAAATGASHVDGAALSRAIDRLSHRAPGMRPIAIGPSDVVLGLPMVARGESVALDGILSRFTFDPATGDSPVGAVLLCTTYDARTRLVDAIDVPIAVGPIDCR